MKKWILVVFVLLSQMAFSQNSFKVQVDTSFKVENYWPAHMISCVDGGIAFTGLNYGPYLNTFIYKCDSNGNYEWSNYYNLDMDDVGPNAIQLKATCDSGFYLLSQARHDMFGEFDTPTLQKVNKDGIVTSAVRMSVPGQIGNTLHLNSVEKLNNNLNGFGVSFNGNNGNPCCSQGYSFKLNTTLGIMRRIGFEWLFYDSQDVPFGAYNKTDTNNYWNGFELYDTSGYHFSSIQYYTDSNHVNMIYPIIYCQDNSYFYFFDMVLYDTTPRFCIHKVDKNFNTVFAVLLDTSNTLFMTYLTEIQMDKRANGNLLISGLKHLGQNNIIPFMMEMDSSGIIIQAFKGDSADSLYISSAIDTISGSFLFGSKNYYGPVSPFTIEREFLYSPTCGFIPVTLNTFPISIFDSVFVASDTLLEGTNPICLNITAPEVNIPLVPGFPLCGVLSGNHDPSPTGNCIPSIYPNPANDKINISFNCEINQKAEVKIFNIIGDEVFSKNISTSNYETTFDVSELPAGIYLVKSQSGDKAVFNSKIVIQK